VDSITPLAGVISTLFFKLPQSVFGIVLALFAGFFLYIGASDLLPESQRTQPAIWTTLATVLGIAVIYVAIRLAGL
jgi:ZIP family zinc transporter